PDVLKVLPVRIGRRRFIEIDWNLKALPYLFSDLARDGDTVLNGHALNGDKRNHVGGADARMCALMLGEVDQLRGLAYAANRRLGNGFAIADNGYDAPVMVGIHLAIQQRDAGNFHGVDNGVNYGFVAAFREIGNAFNECGHLWRG